MLKKLVKNAFHYAGFKLERRNPLEESIPAAYNRSPFLPRIYRDSVYRTMYFHDQLEKISDIDGDIVECGVSIGHGALLLILLSEYIGVDRTYYGFDSFEGFPDSVEKDENPPIPGKGFYATPPETVLRVLRDGKITDNSINEQVRLIKGYFDRTLQTYNGKIALLHLDGDLYASYKISLESLYDKVVSGGIIMFDEYLDKRWPGATKAIDEFFVDKPERILTHDKCNWKYYAVKE